LKAFADQNFIVWSGKIWDSEAYGLSMQLRTSSFPFLALLVCESERTVQIADRIQGEFLPPEKLINPFSNTSSDI
jgi:hypothetical protein